MSVAVTSTPATTPTQNSGSGVSTVSVSASGDSLLRRFPAAWTLGANVPTSTVSFRTALGSNPMLAPFESAVLVDVAVTITLTPGTGRDVLFCFSPSATAPTDAPGFLSQPVGGIIVGAIQIPNERSFVLGSSHPFGRELKTAVLGNPTPHLHIRYTGGTAGSVTPDVYVQLVASIRTSGVGIIPRVVV
jgi:hypothetical protein